MVDGLTPQDPAGQPFDAVDESGAPLPPEEEKKGLFSSPIARILGIVAAVLVVLVICGVIAMLVFTFFIAEEAQDVIDDVASQAATETEPAGGSSEATGVVPVEPEPVSYSRIFTFRDIFDPYYSAPIICDTTGTVEGTSTTEGKLTADVSSGTLYLEAIVIENGEPTAVLLWEGTEYRLTEGQGIPGTPWLVQTINETSVVMLYGDQQVILSIGQGTSR